MQTWVRRHHFIVSMMLALLSLLLVFGAALRVIPADLLPVIPRYLIKLIPDINAIISALVILVISYGWYAIRTNNITRHRQAMVTGAGLFGLFLALYLYKVILVGPTEFTGLVWVTTYIYYPILGFHILLAIVCIPVLYYVLTIGLSFPRTKIPNTKHKQIGRIAVPLWLATFGLGLVVYPCYISRYS